MTRTPALLSLMLALASEGCARTQNREPNPTFGVCLSVISYDRDDDSLDDDVDQCPDDPEDFDGHEDEDGCPDRDNDGDGVLDAAEYKDRRWINNDRAVLPDGSERDCRDEPEDFDGVDDEDGCPDPVPAPDGAGPDENAGAARARILDNLERGGQLPADVLARLRRR